VHAGYVAEAPPGKWMVPDYRGGPSSDQRAQRSGFSFLSLSSASPRSSLNLLCRCGAGMAQCDVQLIRSDADRDRRGRNQDALVQHEATSGLDLSLMDSIRPDRAHNCACLPSLLPPQLALHSEGQRGFPWTRSSSSSWSMSLNSGCIRAVSIHVLPFEDHARWHFLEKNATWRSRFCREQNRNRCSSCLSRPVFKAIWMRSVLIESSFQTQFLSVAGESG
jgi:hypothetical protein